ncbi:hypothetical protein [Mycobacteroides salmoniphilum]|uniref:hypothetical protein n=1 Tax=Mycobacteroides salmoniphilum TaxID=404941 RepID=UPI0010D9D8E9|nr:hypothetical protein [Mycobacteroides salmoniphilum]TDZ97960.1 hypothetical protein CCUG62472_00989 [Mycobacteroides salmoniphilum]
MMSKSEMVFVGTLTCVALGLLSLAVVARVLSEMRRACAVDSSVGDGFGFLIAAPLILFGTMAVTGVLFALTVVLVQRDWAVYAAAGVAVLAAAVLVVVGVGHLYNPGRYDVSQACPSGAPAWWPFPV